MWYIVCSLPRCKVVVAGMYVLVCACLVCHCVLVLREVYAGMLVILKTFS